jgi:hypothetical protein
LRSVSGFHLAPCLAIIFRSFLWPYARAFAPRTPLNKTFSRAANALIVLGNAPRNAFAYGVISLMRESFGAGFYYFQGRGSRSRALNGHFRAVILLTLSMYALHGDKRVHSFAITLVKGLKFYKTYTRGGIPFLVNKPFKLF